MNKLKICVCTANIGNAEPDLSSVAAWIPPLGRCDALKPLQDTPLSDNFDLIVIGMQESTFSKGATLSERQSSIEDDDNDDTTGNDDSEHTSEKDSSTLPRPNIAKVLSKPQELMEEMLEEAYDSQTLKAMFQDTLGSDYQLLASQQRGQMRLYIFMHARLQSVLTEKDVDVKCENTGVGHVLANKGGIVATVTCQGTRISFLTAHLAAHEGPQYYKARCDNLREILRGAKTGEFKHDVAVSSHYFFVLGDLNFRTKFANGKPNKEQDAGNVQRALELIQAQDFETLYRFDELHQGMANGDLLVDFTTLPCHFNPTFKVLRQAGFCYKEQRVPSYTDRILYKTADSLNLVPLAYEPCVDFVTSDHKPIRGAFEIELNETHAESEVEPRHLVFSELSCENLPSMDVDGLSDPYIKFVWDGVDMTSDEITGKKRRSKMGSKSNWPSTKMIPKELNPVWQEEIGLVVNGPVGNGAVLFLTVMDYDATSQDDLMCTLALNVQSLIHNAAQCNTFRMKKPLMKYGTVHGTIQFTLTVKKYEGAVPAKDEQPRLAEKIISAPRKLGNKVGSALGIGKK